MPASSAAHPDAAALQQIRAALLRAEERLSLDIEVVVAQSTGRYDRARLLFGCLAGLVGAAAVWLLLPDAAAEPDSWAGYSPGVKLLLAAAALIVLALAGAVLAGHFSGLARPFVSRREIEGNLYHSMRRAHPWPVSPNQDPLASGPATANTAAPTEIPTPADGTLYLYVSLYERRAALLAGPAVHARMGERQLDQFAEQLMDRLRDQPAADAIVQTLDALTG